MKNKIIFALGSNLGNRKSNLTKAVLELEKSLSLEDIKTSKILKNKALLLPDSPKEWNIDFYNAALSADIDIKEFPPLKILEICQETEKKLGRIDRGKWSPREIDIDILAIDTLTINIDDKLSIPHKELFNRQFFISRFGQIEPELLYQLSSKIHAKS
ncbi:2-amino-4-hydroxy-6-hydroxymethyldihydropteridine diphosphokinase [Rickettsiales bacterium]|nr:2-amino-4-hydroxy-6-hydroxymethyldihydropteridine diphosphokinase [Rickettsiales bacterium]